MITTLNVTDERFNYSNTLISQISIGQCPSRLDQWWFVRVPPPPSPLPPPPSARSAQQHARPSSTLGPAARSARPARGGYGRGRARWCRGRPCAGSGGCGAGRSADAPHALQPLVQRLPQPQGGWGGLVRVMAGCEPIYGRRERERDNSDGESIIREKGL